MTMTTLPEKLNRIYFLMQWLLKVESNGLVYPLDVDGRSKEVVLLIVLFGEVLVR